MKSITAVLLALLMLVAFCACGETDEGGAKPKDSDPLVNSTWSLWGMSTDTTAVDFSQLAGNGIFYNISFLPDGFFASDIFGEGTYAKDGSSIIFTSGENKVTGELKDGAIHFDTSDGVGMTFIERGTEVSTGGLDGSKWLTSGISDMSGTYDASALAEMGVSGFVSFNGSSFTMEIESGGQTKTQQGIFITDGKLMILTVDGQSVLGVIENDTLTIDESGIVTVYTRQ